MRLVHGVPPKDVLRGMLRSKKTPVKRCNSCENPLHKVIPREEKFAASLKAGRTHAYVFDIF